ncbi:DUF1467 family protein [Jannaschia seohaensis]|uniref:Predicted secreted protein n=1 Tax=Jannaschia seohaensis TaxID=475081 RepID=A0A2Y9C2Q6_9RHOB|nr:DUF1467 family protein [Jannaschia seohaensis]PWJ14411.1 putative secreted protein [Jannaschia seohaensis]SSA50132.1 Predicted secreted protein [Jannaschia seohaensis]
MGVFSALVLFAMIWAMVFLIGLQIGQDTQGDRGQVTQGTHAGAPAAPIRIYRRMGWATAITLLIWVPLIWFIATGQIGIDDLRRITGREVLGD